MDYKILKKSIKQLLFGITMFLCIVSALSLLCLPINFPHENLLSSDEFYIWLCTIPLTLLGVLITIYKVNSGEWS